MLLRILSSLVLIPLTILIVWKGGSLCMLVTVCLVIITLLEMCQLTESIGAKFSRLLTIFCGLLLCLPSALVYLPNFEYPNWFSSELVLFLVLLLSFCYQIQQGRSDFLPPAANFVNAVYVGWGFGYHILRLRQVGGQKSFLGFCLVLFLLGVIWAGDTLAYLIGKLVGRYKLRPDISPGKTIEGAIAGLVGSILAGVAIWSLLLVDQVPMMTLSLTLIASLLIGITSQVSDLSESIIKRSAGVKDSGRLIPGHGGLLDRLDSMMFATPTFYYSLKLFKLI